MSLTDFVVLALAGILGGALNTAAAGGGVITFLTCLLVGMPPQVAIATSQVAIPASFLGAVVPTWRQRRRFRPILPAVVAAVVGTAIGVWLVYRLDAHTFRLIAPWLLVVAGVLLVVQPYLPGGVRAPHLPASPPLADVGELERREPADLGSRRRRIALTVALFLTALYGGGFGGGVGVAVLLVLATITGWAWDTTNTMKNGLCLAMSFMCSAAFLFTGLANLAAVVVLVAGQLGGGVLGVWAFQHLSEDALRRTVAVATAVGAVVMVGSS